MKEFHTWLESAGEEWRWETTINSKYGKSEDDTGITDDYMSMLADFVSSLAGLDDDEVEDFKEWMKSAETGDKYNDEIVANEVSDDLIEVEIAFNNMEDVGSAYIEFKRIQSVSNESLRKFVIAMIKTEIASSDDRESLIGLIRKLGGPDAVKRAIGG